MMCAWSNQSNAAEWRTRIPSQVFARCYASKGCSAIRMLGSTPWFIGKEQDLRHLRHVASHLVGSRRPTGAGFALHRLPQLPRFGGPSGGLPAVWHDEARATGLPSRKRTAWDELGPVVSERCRSGVIRDVAEEPHLNWQTVKRVQIDFIREQIRRVRTRRPKVIGNGEISIRKGDYLPDRGQRPRSAPTDPARRRPPERGEHSPVLSRSRPKNRQAHPSRRHGHVKGVSLCDERESTTDRPPIRKAHVMKHLAEALTKISKAEYARFGSKRRQFIEGQNTPFGCTRKPSPVPQEKKGSSCGEPQARP